MFGGTLERSPVMRPKIFIGSSIEGLEVARLVKEHLNEWADCSLWTDPEIFVASSTVIESLEKALPLFPYAVFVMTPDDSAVIREKQYLVHARQSGVRVRAFRWSA